MGLIVALKHNGVVYMGSDSGASREGVKFYLSNPNMYRIFKVKGFDNMLMGLSGRVNEHNIVKTNELVPANVAHSGKIDFDFMVNEFVPRLFSLYDDRGLIEKTDDSRFCSSDMIVAYKDTIYQITSDGTVVQVNDFAAIGNCAENALGCLLSTQDETDPVKRVLKALMVCAKRYSNVSYPLIVTNTKTGEFKLFTE